MSIEGYIITEEPHEEWKMECKLCWCLINVCGCTRLGLVRHIHSKEHKAKLKSITSPPKPSNDSYENKTEIAELLMAFDMMREFDSFRNANFSFDFNHSRFKHSKIARQTLESIILVTLIKDVLYPHLLKSVLSDFKRDGFFGISTYSNYFNKDKSFPIMLHYFSEKTGLQVKLLKMYCFSCIYSASTVINYVLEFMKSLNISIGKCVALGVKDMNPTRECHSYNDVFLHLKRMGNSNMFSIPCMERTLDNIAYQAVKTLSVNVKVLIQQLFWYYFPNQQERNDLKTFIDELQTVYPYGVLNVESEWSKFYIAINHVLKNFQELKSFFLHEEEKTTDIANFFYNPFGEAYLWVVHNFLNFINKQMIKIQKPNVTVLEVKVVVDETIQMLNFRIIYQFLPLKAKEVLDRISQDVNVEKFKKEITNLYTVAKILIESRSKILQQFQYLDWMLMKNIPTWNDILNCTHLFEANYVNFDDDLMFHQFTVVNEAATAEMENAEVWTSLSCSEKWAKILSRIPLIDQKSGFIWLCSYLCSIPCHNAGCDYIFNLDDIRWTEEDDELTSSTTSAIRTCIYYLKDTNSEAFEEYIKENKEILRAVKVFNTYQYI